VEPVRSSKVIPAIPDLSFDGQTVDVNFFLTKEYDDIDEASTELPSLIEWISSKQQAILEQKLRMENKVKELEAETWFYLLNGGFEDNNYAGKKTTFSLTMGVRLNPKVKEAKEELAILSGWNQRLVNLIYGFQSKLDIVRSVEATRRTNLNQPEPEQSL
jgi:hypothetical protein